MICMEEGGQNVREKVLQEMPVSAVVGVADGSGSVSVLCGKWQMRLPDVVDNCRNPVWNSPHTYLDGSQGI